MLAQAHCRAHLPDLQDGIVLDWCAAECRWRIEVAMDCGLPLDVMIVRKIGAPGNREYAMGAVAAGGVVVLNPEVVRDFHVTKKSCTT